MDRDPDDPWYTKLKHSCRNPGDRYPYNFSKRGKPIGVSPRA